MRRLQLLPLMLFSLFIFSSCGDSEDKWAENKEAEGMTDFAKDTQFQEQHEIPDTIDYLEMGEMKSIPIDGQKDAAYYAVNQENSHAVLLMFHEWWGLNEHIKREAGRYAKKLPDVNVWALDLYDGKVADSRDSASAYMEAAEEERIYAIIQAALQEAGINTPVATIGWCYGGGWSLKAAITAGDQAEACVMYYGMPVQEASALKGLSAPVLGLFAKQDDWITPEVVKDFEQLMDEAGKKVETHIFDAKHAFANPSSPRYNEEAAQKANKLAHDFLSTQIGSKDAQ
jgi:carboxymethylenebutenolidase